LYSAGRLKWRETVAEGFEQAPAALVSMLSGGNIGKQVVRLGAAAESRVGETAYS
jgi:NADPH-dependent curcumin reductase